MTTNSLLLCGTAVLTLAASGALAQPLGDPACDLVAGVLPDGCDRANGGTVVTMPAEPNSEWDQGGAPDTGVGFQIVIDGQPLIGDERVEDSIRQTDLALADADIQIRFDGLGAKPRLDMQRSEATREMVAGDTVTFTSQLNYPAYVTRGEIRVIDRAGIGSEGKLLAVVPVDPNGQATITVPEGGRVVAVHRVYDAEGRYDETMDIPLSLSDSRNLAEGVEEGSDAATRRAIPVRGGAVTVSGENVAPGGTVYTLGEAVAPAPEGDFVMQRILPVGAHAIDVRVVGPSQDLSFSRDIEIPRYDIFYTALTDVTIGLNEEEDGDTDTYTRGRLAFYVNGYTADGTEFTIAADTQEDDVQDLFSEFDEKDPSSLLDRIDPNEFYPTYGDGSSIVEDAPTQGKFYLRVEKDRNYFIWGNSQAELSNTEYLRNERVLYGANAHWESQRQTSFGEPRAQFTLYAARPDNLPQRDVLRGTGGSIYFLSRQDITRGSEVVTVELRDSTTGRVIDRRQLRPGIDYEVNHLQGSVRLAQPLSAWAGEGVVVTNPGGDSEVNLVVQYEYTPVDLSVDGSSLGGRAEAWLTDSVRVGVSGQHDDTGLADQEAYGGDIHFRLGARSFIEAEYARSEGPGYGYRSSLDGGLIYDTTDSEDGTGDALRVDAEIDLQEVGLTTEGVVTAYYEDREEGFTSLDYTVSTGERLWGFEADIRSSERLTWRGYYDTVRDDEDRREEEGGFEALYDMDGTNKWAFGIEHVRRETLRESGKRTDVALRYTRVVSEDLSFSLLGQTTVSHDGLSRNNRVGLGVERDFGNGWTLAGEISDGTLGTGADVLASYEREDGSSLYFGYELDPDAFDRRGSFNSLSENKGRFVVGGRRNVNDRTTMYAENTYEVFSDRDTLTSTYGVDYQANDFLTYSLGFDIGQIEDDESGDFKRRAVSLGAKYQDDKLTASGRIEYRRERDDDDRPMTLDRDADTLLISMKADYDIDESRTLLGYFDYADTDTDESSIRDGRLTDVVLGFALRPVTNDRLNMLFKYRYLYDMYGQTVDGTDSRGPRQESHVFTLDAEYDLTEKWALGGKIGGRWSEAASTSSDDFYENDAWLVVANARYHIVHNWDVLLEARALHQEQADTTDSGFLAAGYRHFGNNFKVGAGYNFGKFSDDLTDLTLDDQGVFLNAIAKF
ncbi:hypothetical protein ACMA5I_13015 [Paracoccaceae bacterium GXU_MW_L88]